MSRRVLVYALLASACVVRCDLNPQPEPPSAPAIMVPEGIGGAPTLPAGNGGGTVGFGNGGSAGSFAPDAGVAITPPDAGDAGEDATARHQL